MSYLRLLLASVLIALPTLALCGENRGWTDNQGRTIQAEFVRVFNGMVILQQGTKVLQVPLSNLSPEDQAFVRNGGQETGDENEPIAIDGPTDPQQRNWTDRQGNQIQATFVRLHENQVVLKAGGRVKSIGIEQFSSADHDYVKQMLTAQGQPAEAAALDQYLASQTPGAGGNTGGNAPTVPSFPSANSFMEKQLAESRRRMEEQQRLLDQRTEQQRQAREAQQQNDLAQQQQAEARRQQEAQERSDREARQREEALANNSGPNNNPSDFPQTSYSPPSFDPSGGNSDMYYEDVYQCSSCLKEVPGHVGAGSKCPHCGITFDYVEDSSGNRTYRDGATRYGGIGFIVLTVIGIGIRVMVAMARD